MNEFIEKLFTLYSHGFYDSYGRVWQAVTKDNFTKALKEALDIGRKEYNETIEKIAKFHYDKGVEDAIEVCNEAIKTDFSGALRNRIWVRNKIQQLKEK